MSDTFGAHRSTQACIHDARCGLVGSCVVCLRLRSSSIFDLNMHIIIIISITSSQVICYKIHGHLGAEKYGKVNTKKEYYAGKAPRKLMSYSIF
jgi:hypothetical protein